MENSSLVSATREVILVGSLERSGRPTTFVPPCGSDHKGYDNVTVRRWAGTAQYHRAHSVAGGQQCIKQYLAVQRKSPITGNTDGTGPE